MVMTNSTMLPIGTKAPDFCLPEPLTQKEKSLRELSSGAEATVIIFMCNHCPFVLHILPSLIHTAKEYKAKKISFIGINSNDVLNYPEDSPGAMVPFIQKTGMNFTYLFDETQQIAKNYNAACTPDFFVFDKNLALVYRGQYDESRPGSQIQITGADLTKALDLTLSKMPLDYPQMPSLGCNIKWKSNEPG
jgi:thiol-disulfide isomerase/thioredoxin